MKPQQTILIVDDEAEVRGLVREVLEQEGYRVIDADTGERAIEVGRSAESIRLVISDMFLHTMDGIQLVGRLSILQPGIKALLISGDLAEVKAPNRNADFLEKPFSCDELTTKVKTLLRQW